MPVAEELPEDAQAQAQTDSLNRLDSLFRGPPEPSKPAPRAPGPLDALADTFGNPQWANERIPQQDRVNDFIRARATTSAEQPNTPDEWQKVADEAKQYFPGLDPETIKQPFQAAKQQSLNQVRLGQAKEKYKNFEEPGFMTVMREGLPVGTTAWNFLEKKAYAESKDRLAKGEYNPGDYARVAHFEKLQENKQNESLGKSALRTAMNVGTFAGEAYLGGTALKAAGVLPTIALGGGAVAEAPTLAARLVGSTMGTRLIAQTALMPSMWLPQSVDQAMQKGGNWSDIKNLGPAFGMGMMQVGLLGAASRAGGSVTAAKLLPGIAEGGVEGWATRLVAGTGTAMAGQAGIDVANGIITSQLPVWGHKGYGTAADLIQGKEGAPKAMALQLLTFALFNVGHAHNNPIGEARAADAQAGKAIMDLGSQYVGRLKSLGYGETAAYEKAMRAHGLIMEAVQGKDISAARGRLDQMTGQYVDALAEGMHLDQLAAEQKAADIAQRNPTAGDFRGQFGSEEAKTEQPASQKPTPATETPQTPPTAPKSAAPEPTPEPVQAPQTTTEAFAQRLAKGERPADVFKDVFEGKRTDPATWKAIEDRASELKPGWNAPIKAMVNTAPGAGKVAPEAQAPQVPRGTEGAERYYRVPNSKTEGSNVEAALKELRGGTFANLFASRGAEANAPYHKAGKVQFEFASERFQGKEQGDFVEHTGKTEATLGGTAPMYMHRALTAIRYRGSADSPEFATLKEKIGDYNQARAAKGLEPIKLEATEGAQQLPTSREVSPPNPLAGKGEVDAQQSASNTSQAGRDSPVEPAPEPPKAPEPSGPVKPPMTEAEFKAAHPEVLTPEDATAAVKAARRALADAGKSGLNTAPFVAKLKAALDAQNEVASRIRQKRGGDQTLPPEMEASINAAKLTDYEKQIVLARVTDSDSTRVLGEKLGVSRTTISTDARAALEKLKQSDPELWQDVKARMEDMQTQALRQRAERQAGDAQQPLDEEDPDTGVHLEADQPKLSKLTPDELAQEKAETQEFLDALARQPDQTDSGPPRVRPEDQPNLRGQSPTAGDQPAAAATEGAADQGPAQPPEAAPAARGAAAGRELKFRTVAQAVSARGGIDPKTFASIHGLEVTREFMKEFPGLFRGRNLRGGSNKFEELVPGLVEDGVFSVPDGVKPTDAFLDVIKAKALDMSQNLDAKYQQESERYAQQEAAVKQVGFSADAVKGARAVGEELADLEESERVAEADRAVQESQGRRPAPAAGESVQEPGHAAEEDAGRGDDGGARAPGGDEFDFGANARPRAMGAAALGELTPGEGKVYRGETALANAKIDAERTQEGLNPIIRSARMDNAEAWDAAMRRLDSDPAAGSKLVEDIITKNRPVDVVENALLLREKIRLDNEYRVLSKQLAEAKPDADTEGLERRLNELLDARYDLALAAKRSGTEWGRSGQFRRQLAAEDYSLTGMLTEARLARGRPLSEGEKAEVGKRQKEVEDAERTDPDSPKTARKKQGWTEDMNILRWARKPFVEKGMDLIAKWKRFAVLSNPIVLGKLTTAALWRMGITPAEEAVGAVWGKVLPGIAAKAPLEAGFNYKAEVTALGKAFTEGLKDAKDVLLTGRSDLGVKYGAAKDSGGYAKFLDIPGQIHGALKAPTARAAFERAAVKLADSAIRQGLDPTDPAVSARLMAEAYKASERSIFLQDSRVADGVQNLIRTLEKPNESGRVPLVGKTLATGLRVAMPIIKVPTNIVAEAWTYATGLVSGGLRAGRAYRNGIENLTPQEGDLIMRQLKKGSLGAAALAVGFLTAGKNGVFQTGGYYQDKEKRDQDEAPASGFTILGVPIPRWIVHNPLLEVTQIGATFRRAYDAAKTDDANAVTVGAAEALLGLAEEVPMVRESLEVNKAFKPHGLNRFLGSQVKSFAVPGAVSATAEQLDRPRDGLNIGPKTPRKVGGKGVDAATTVKEEVQSGIPWWRQGLRPK